LSFRLFSASICVSFPFVINLRQTSIYVLLSFLCTIVSSSNLCLLPLVKISLLLNDICLFYLLNHHYYPSIYAFFT
jgi:hypothetical protein